MSDLDLNEVPMTHWLVAGAALIWYAFGFMIYYQTVTLTPEQMAATFNAEQIALMEAMPVWATAAYGFAVTSGVLACLLLLMRRALALPLFIVSLVAVLVQNLHTFLLSDSVGVFGMAPVYIQSTVIVIGIAMILYCRRARRQGLLS